MEKKIAIGIIEDFEKSLENNGIIAQEPEMEQNRKIKGGHRQ